MEAELEKKLTGAIFGFKNGTKKPAEVQSLINQLKAVNPLLAEDYSKKYVQAARERSAQKK